MSTSVEMVMVLVSLLMDQVSVFFTALAEASVLSVVGMNMAAALVPVPQKPEDSLASVLATARRWHGTITDKFVNINSATNLLKEFGDAWGVPAEMLAGMVSWRNKLQILIPHCASGGGSSIDRIDRDAILNPVIAYCLHTVKFWALGQESAGVMTPADVHKLGFLLPSEMGRRHGRALPTTVLAEVKVKVLSGDKIKVVIDQAVAENAAQVYHGWPTGVKQALIVISEAEGDREVHREITTRLHNDIVMPAGCHGKQFGVKVSFLKHANDAPTFCDGAVFSMPLTSDDLFAELERQHQIEAAESARTVERHRAEVQQLEEEIAKLKKG